MDKNTVTGLLLIFVITMAWAFYTMPGEEDLQQQRLEQARQDSIAAAQAERQQDDPVVEDTEQAAPTSPQTETSEPRGQETLSAMGVFREASYPDTVKTVIRNSLYEIELSNLGAGPVKYVLLGHNTWDQNPVQMIRDTSRSTYSLGFLSTQNYNIETDELLFEPLFDDEVIEISSDESAELSYQLNLGDGSRIVFTYTF
ncbi:MAG: hypothetical protein WD139_13815, partial [Balneolaceae bacterium]